MKFLTRLFKNEIEPEFTISTTNKCYRKDGSFYEEDISKFCGKIGESVMFCPFNQNPNKVHRLYIRVWRGIPDQHSAGNVSEQYKNKMLEHLSKGGWFTGKITSISKNSVTVSCKTLYPDTDKELIEIEKVAKHGK